MNNVQKARVIAGLITALLLIYPISLTLGAMNLQRNNRTVFIEAKQFEFTPSKIEAKLGDTITFILQSNDSQHGFYIQELGINQVVNIQAPSEITVVIDQAGTFLFLCNVPCGNYHPYMNGKLYVSPNIQHIFFTYILVILSSALIIKAERDWERRKSIQILELVEEN